MSPNPFADLSIFSFIFYFAIAGLTAYYAHFKGRNSLTWFFIALLIGFIAPLVLMFLPSLKKEEQTLIKDQQTPLSNEPFPVQSAFDQPVNSSFPLTNLPEEENKLWYYMDQSHQQMGPVSIIALRELWHTARLELSSYVWSQGMVDWKKVDDLPELKILLNKANLL